MFRNPKLLRSSRMHAGVPKTRRKSHLKKLQQTLENSNKLKKK